MHSGKCQDFRRLLEHRRKQMMIARAKAVARVVLDILS